MSDQEISNIEQELTDGLLYLVGNFNKIKSAKHSFNEMTIIRDKVVKACNQCGAFEKKDKA